MKKVLMIAYHYPPFCGGSGRERTLQFSRYLPENGWLPIVLTANPRAYTNVDKDEELSALYNIIVRRTFALDASKDLSIKGRYFKWTALPDRWASWWLTAVPAGLSLIKRYRPEILWSTYPIATAHLIGLTLSRLTRIPWITDFRDPLTEEGYPADATVCRVYRWIEEKAVNNCLKAIFTTQGTLNMYAERYSYIPKSHWKVIANGYDEEDFVYTEKELAGKPKNDYRLMLLHSGIIYPYERDPNTFFDALAELRKSDKISPSDLKIILRASGENENNYRKRVNELGIGDIVFFEPTTTHKEAIAEMLIADGLLILQGRNCNYQIPAKIYEYLRARRPIFAMTDLKGNTAMFLRSLGVDTIVPLDSKEKIKAGLVDFIAKIKQNKALLIGMDRVMNYSRRAETSQLAQILNEIAS